MTDKIADATQRARGYWFIDGLAEIGGGILFIVISIPYLLWSLVPVGSSMAKLASGGRDVLLLLGIVIFYVVIRAAKLRSTYPRTGYVEDQRPSRQRILAAVAILASLLVFAGLMVAGILLFPAFCLGLLNTLVYFPTIFGFFFTLGQVVLGFRTYIKRFFILAGVAALASIGLAVNSFVYLAAHPVDWRPLFASSSGSMPAGLSLALLNLFHSVYQGVALLAAVFGLAMLVSGLVTRRMYLWQNPLPIEAPDEQ